MSVCNFCTLRGIRSRAKAEGATVHVENGNVFVVPKGEKLDTSVDKKGNHGPQFVAWLMEVTGTCCC
jgi:ethanolamine utilization protein EutQ (cupin superfamily)